VFSPQRRSLEWRRALGIGDEEVAIGFLGRLVMEKGLDVFAGALAELRARGVPHRALVIGEGPAGEWFAERLPRAGEPGAAAFAGFHAGEALGRAVAGMDVLLNPSVTETFGNVTLEAMACAVPVVAARATGASSLVADGVTGRLIEPGNIGAFADALEAYVRDPQLRAAHGAAGERASQAYSWEAVNAAVAAAYLRLAVPRALASA
jgi:glycosyltransferase involved in cell wall biosynthesis